MALLLNRAQARDWCRRSVNIVPPNDYPPDDIRYGPPGAQPAGNPTPTNQQLNDGFDQAISLVNAYVGYTTQVIPIPLPASTAQGYVPISMSLLGVNGAPQYLSNLQVGQIGVQQLNDIRRVGFIQSPGGQYQKIYPFDIARSDRDLVIYDNNQPGIPQYYYTDQYNLYITPPNGIAGTLQITVGRGSMSFTHDAGYIEQLPVDYHQFIFQMTTLLAAMKQPGNVEMNTVVQMLGPSAQNVLTRIADWFEANNRYAQPTMGSVDIQRDFGCYRRQRR